MLALVPGKARPEEKDLRANLFQRVRERAKRREAGRRGELIQDTLLSNLSLLCTPDCLIP